MSGVSRLALVLLVLGTTANALNSFLHWPILSLAVLPLLVGSIAASLTHRHRAKRNGESQ